MSKALIGWIIIGVTALVWELLGVFGVDGIWPLTWLVRDSFAHGGEWARVFWLVVIAGGAGLLYRHFFVVRQTYNGKDAGKQ